MKAWKEKSTVEEIRLRFDADVERFANLDTGQEATPDAPLVLELISSAVALTHPRGGTLLDIGCGAGNYTLKILQKNPHFDCHLVDLSENMLERACERIDRTHNLQATSWCGDIRQLGLPENYYDAIVAAAVLHHLRDESDWREVFSKLYALLKPGGNIWISDLVDHDDPVVRELAWSRYGQYLEERGGAKLRKEVFAYIEKEDSPRSLNFQVELLQRCGFVRTEILHKNCCFAAFGAHKPNQ